MEKQKLPLAGEERVKALIYMHNMIDPQRSVGNKELVEIIFDCEGITVTRNQVKRMRAQMIKERGLKAGF